MVTQNQIQVTEEEKKNDARFEEIKKKPEVDRTPEEKTEFGELKTKYAGRAEKRIGQLTGEKKAAAERADENERLLTEQRTKNKELQDKIDSVDTQTIVGNVNETIEVGGKKYYTDNALAAQIKAGTITEQAAIDYQVKRNEEKIVVRVKTDFQKEQDAKATKTAQEADANAILSQHPEFGTKHSNYNPNDPLYVEWKELVANGYGLTNGGLMKALKKAKKNLGIKDTHIDRSGDLGLEDVASPGDKGGKKQEKEVELTDVEENSAIDMFTSVPNPATGRLYTKDEAIAKAKMAKKARIK